jgi:hypothetical protein
MKRAQGYEYRLEDHQEVQSVQRQRLEEEELFAISPLQDPMSFLLGDSFYDDNELLRKYRRKAKEIPVMYPSDWFITSGSCCDLWSNMLPFQITQDDFISSGCRYEIEPSSLPKFKIFPWFQAQNIRFREMLKDDPLKGMTIEDVIRSFNFFFTKLGTFTNPEILYLQSTFRMMSIPTSCRTLTTILEVHHAFTKYYSGDSPLPPFFS